MLCEAELVFGVCCKALKPPNMLVGFGACVVGAAEANRLLLMADFAAEATCGGAEVLLLLDA